MEPQKPIEILLEEVKKIRSNLDRINKDIANIKKIINETAEKEFESDKVVESRYWWFSK